MIENVKGVMQKLKRVFVGFIILIASYHSMEHEELLESSQKLDSDNDNNLSATDFGEYLQRFKRRILIVQNERREKKYFQVLVYSDQHKPLLKRKNL